MFERSPCLQACVVGYQSPVSVLCCRFLHTFLVCSLEAGQSLFNLQHAARCLHVSAEADCQRQVPSCRKTVCLFIDESCEEILPLPGSAHKIIWAFQGLKETGTAYGSVLDYNTHERVPLFRWNIARLSTTLGCQFCSYITQTVGLLRLCCWGD